MNDDLRSRQSRARGVPWMSSSMTGRVASIIMAAVIGFFMGCDQSVRSQAFAPDSVNNHAQSTPSSSRYSPLVSPIELLGFVAKERRILIERVQKVEYGEFAHVLVDPTHLRGLFPMSNESRRRYIRRIQKKLLDKHMHPDWQVQFSWVTGGDKSAAGYGNDKRESYTAILESSLRPVFGAVGIEFRAMYRGNGSLGSTPAAALCLESLYGPDIDVLSWDFPIETEDKPFRSALWTARSATHPTFPLLFVLDSPDLERWQKAVAQGRMAFLDMNALLEVRQRFPDSLAPANPAQLPAALQYYRCGESIEGYILCDDEYQHFMCEMNGGEVCRKHKFRANQLTCNDQRNNHTSWAPGWKEHLLKGRLLAFFLIDLLQEALIELDRMLHDHAHLNLPSTTMRWKVVAEKLQEHHNLDKFLHENQKTSDIEIFGRYADAVSGISRLLLTRRAGCTMVDESMHELIAADNPRSQKSKASCDPTNRAPLLISDGDGWVDIQLPSPPSQEEPASVVGLVIACFRTCTAGDCSNALEGLDTIKIANGNIQIDIDGIPVTTSREMDGCHVLEGSNGEHWSIRTDEGSHPIRFRVNEQGGSMQVFSVITM